MFNLIYKKLYMQDTVESIRTDDSLAQKIRLFLEDKKLGNLDKEEVEELVYVAGSIGHEEGFKCAIEFLHRFFAELFGT